MLFKKREFINTIEVLNYKAHNKMYQKPVNKTNLNLLSLLLKNIIHNKFKRT